MSTDLITSVQTLTLQRQELQDRIVLAGKQERQIVSLRAKKEAELKAVEAELADAIRKLSSTGVKVETMPAKR